ncbi:MAG: hypothetical protein UH854_03205 [Clostridia bacterium]|nr:hypothetical protein [Clostridia bacterium]
MLVLGNNVPYLYLRVNSSRASIITEFKEWLTENNANVMYVLETPIETPIELPFIETNKGTNIFEIRTTLQPSNVIAQYYKKG